MIVCAPVALVVEVVGIASGHQDVNVDHPCYLSLVAQHHIIVGVGHWVIGNGGHVDVSLTNKAITQVVVVPHLHFHLLIRLLAVCEEEGLVPFGLFSSVVVSFCSLRLSGIDADDIRVHRPEEISVSGERGRDWLDLNYH